ncbi:Crp/Fnr family transcriptional regulator [Listeria booriae]|uniref:Crp/Fnr family transcriptional regulator n=1 Tax=Listeria booriae TaxID=1552123 RepID=A0A7X1A5V2_9LIST|nr:Crp/Fnr family transcriptional regulator [Listeria booriae]MBC2371780.1 Crp/Fnr family transcriptional regulator [Listeria booriae]
MMSSKNIFNTFSSVQLILDELKKNRLFAEYCYQERISKGDVLDLKNDYNNHFLLIEYGFFKLNPDINYSSKAQIFLHKGDLLLFASQPQPIFGHPVCVALSDAIWWKLDVTFFKAVLFAENLTNSILIPGLNSMQEKLYIHYLKGGLNARGRILFVIQYMKKFGFLVNKNNIELPHFFNHNILAEFSGTSKGYAIETLYDLRKQGILLSKRKPWVITDREKFKLICNKENIPPVI